jgi:methyl-accepting chemotaxis protein
MFLRRKTPSTAQKLNEAEAVLDALDRTQAVIEFKPDGTILQANSNFLSTMGYSLQEIAGKHHSMFVAKSYASSPEYGQFWSRLAEGEHFTGMFQRVAKDRSTVWIQATYAPVLGPDGSVSKVVKYATDVTDAAERKQVVEDITDGLRQLSAGNLGCQVPVSEVDELAELGAAFNSALRQLNETVGTVKAVAATVASTADELNQSSGEFSQRTETQAATLEQTAAAMEELTATVKAAADGAKEVATIVTRARKTAETSSQVVSDAIRAMDQIETSAGKISTIISVIDDIAFQTNLLALNAGVEAARAGEAGRGFAVVASEVRALAQRSSDAAGEIKQLITESSAQVADGVKLVGRTGDELKAIVESVSTISDHIVDIARGAEEQSVTLEEINSGMGELDGVTQHNAAMVEESTAASQRLANDARALAEQVASFRTTADAGSTAHVQIRPVEVEKPTAPQPTRMTGTGGWQDF